MTIRIKIITFIFISGVILLPNMLDKMPQIVLELKPNIEDRLNDNSYYNPNTQSFLRGHHWLDTVKKATLSINKSGIGTLLLSTPNQHHLDIHNLNMNQLVPRLHYPTTTQPDQFDAFNLMMAEYSRNGLSVPVGKASDKMAHFETDLQEATPWSLTGDYQFKPNPLTRPVRFGVINNCLASGLWEFIATDRTGEIYHSWYKMPSTHYHHLIAKTNGLEKSFVQAAVKWTPDPVTIDLDRLRHHQTDIATVSLNITEDVAVGFSSQDSRRKLHKRFVEVLQNDQWKIPKNIYELTTFRCRFSDFIAPGKYSLQHKKVFDFRFLGMVKNAVVSEVLPLTHYDWQNKHASKAIANERYIELTLHLDAHQFIIGNLPLRLLVPQEDFTLHGFGVGILSSGGLAERRNYLINDGPAPSFAYLCQGEGDSLVALNSHDLGIEQIFIRTHIEGDQFWWEITITSYERIVDIVKYKVAIPEQLKRASREYALEYVSPLYRTYRDDNIR